MCGKYLIITILLEERLGSPPHVREIRYNPLLDSDLVRITPACAGNTSRSFQGKLIGLGSPPHVREIRFITAEKERDIRITPACAGNTLKDPSMTLPAI